MVVVVVGKRNRENRETIDDAIVAVIGRSCLRFETIVRISNEIQTKRWQPLVFERVMIGETFDTISKNTCVT